MDDTWLNRFRDRYGFLKLTEGLTQKKLADKINVSQPTIGHWLRGKTEPDSIDLYIKLSEAIKLHPAKLLFDMDPVPDALLKLVLDISQLDEESVVLIKQLAARLKANTPDADKRAVPDRRKDQRRTS